MNATESETAVISEAVYPWQKEVWEMLTTRFPSIGHGLLLYGKSGCGKQAFAQHFLAWVLCANRHPEGACGQCGSCQWLKSDTHPNYVHISTDEDNKKSNAQIKIEKIRELLPFVQQTVDGWRIVLIQPADALNTASANALLKTLEEPGDRVLILLITEHFLKLPATIRSRLQRFALDRISFPDAAQYVQQRLPDVDESYIQLLLNLANGMPLQALKLNQQNWLQKRHEFLVDWQDLVIQKRLPIHYASKWTKQLSYADFEQLIEYLLSDLIAYKLGQPIKNNDLGLSSIAAYYDLKSLFQIYDNLQQSKIMLEQNVQAQLILDQLFVQLMNVE
ncbi:MAG: AAA family ATPase [Acinetobacter sp.]